MTRAKRREAATSGGLGAMSDADLQDIYFFGNVVTANSAIVFTASPEDQRRAAEILEERGTLHF